MSVTLSRAFSYGDDLADEDRESRPRLMLMGLRRYVEQDIHGEDDFVHGRIQRAGSQLGGR